MSTPAIVPMFDPQGVLRDIPYERVMEAKNAGAEIGVRMKAPDGTVRVVPASRYAEAAKQGGKVLPIEQQAVEKLGFWETMGADLKAAVAGLPNAIKQGLAPITGGQVSLEGPAAAVAADEQRAKQGRGALYRAGALTATAAGANVQGMEQAAEEGNSAAIVGHAAAGAVPYIAGSAAGAAKEILGPEVEALARTKAGEMYQSALKPSTRLSPAKVQNAVQTGLSAEIPVSEAGVEKLTGLIEDLNDKIKAQIPQNSPQTVNKFKVASRLSDTAKKFETQVNPEADMNAIAESGNEFLRNQPNGIPAYDAQKLKQGTYQQLGSKAYGEMKTATIEAQKALARGIKEELVAQFPELKALNAQESKFLNLEPLLEHAVQRISNHQLIGIGTPAVGTTAAVLTGSRSVGALAGVLKMVVDNPAIKSRLAIALNRAGLDLPTSLARIGAYSTALAQGATSANGEIPDGQSSQP